MFFRLYSITEAAMQYLLDILNSEGIEVPPSIYMLKKEDITNKLDIVRLNMSTDGALAYLSIKENIKCCLAQNLISLPNQALLKIVINGDGVSLFKSSPATLWPTLFQLKDYLINPLPVAVYAGLRKLNFDEFVTPLSKD